MIFFNFPFYNTKKIFKYYFRQWNQIELFILTYIYLNFSSIASFTLSSSLLNFTSAIISVIKFPTPPIIPNIPKSGISPIHIFFSTSLAPSILSCSFNFLKYAVITSFVYFCRS